MANWKWKLVKVSRLLQPDGSAFKIPFGGDMEKLYRALMSDSIGGLGRAYNDARGLFGHVFPDDPAFTIEDARIWYRNLGLYDSGDVPLADMKAAIKQKRSFAAAPMDMQHETFIEDQLRAAGFDVHVYRNKFPDGIGGYMVKSPSEVLGYASGIAELGAFELDEVELGDEWADTDVTLCVNHIEEDLDAVYSFDPVTGYKDTFFIAGATVDAFATVPGSRKVEFRQLILKLKSAHTAAILFVNYS